MGGGSGRSRAAAGGTGFLVLKKNRFLFFVILNTVLLIVILFLSIPISKLLKKIDLEDNEFIEGQVIINPKAVSPAILDREVNIKLLAKVDESLNWSFEPLQDNIVVKIGENTKVEYIGKNLTNEILTSTANFVASPDTIQPYLIKSECFCFIEQTLNSGESKIFTMVFFIDPSMDSDKNFNDLKELVFTYEFSEYKS